VAVIVMVAPDNRLPTLLPYLPEVEQTILTLKPNELIEVFLPTQDV
jgi:hypothetical protein